VPKFSTLILHASRTFGAPAHVARVLGREPYDIYRWIAGVEQPAPAEQASLTARLQAALARPIYDAPARRRWSDHRWTLAA